MKKFYIERINDEIKVKYSTDPDDLTKMTLLSINKGGRLISYSETKGPLSLIALKDFNIETFEYLLRNKGIVSVFKYMITDTQILYEDVFPGCTYKEEELFYLKIQELKNIDPLDFEYSFTYVLNEMNKNKLDSIVNKNSKMTKTEIINNLIHLYDPNI